MSRKEEILRNAEEMARRERERGSPDGPYDGRGMVSKMPAGCWLWMIILIVLAVYGFAKLLHGIH